MLSRLTATGIENIFLFFAELIIINENEQKLVTRKAKRISFSTLKSIERNQNETDQITSQLVVVMSAIWNEWIFVFIQRTPETRIVKNSLTLTAPKENHHHSQWETSLSSKPKKKEKSIALPHKAMENQEQKKMQSSKRELTPTNCTRDLKNNWSEMFVFAAKSSEKITRNW